MAPVGLRSSTGFSMVDIVVAVALIGIVAAIAIPTLTNAVEQMRLGQSGREVERELQTAKQRAVARGRIMRVRFNCPAAGEYRIVELIGSASAPAAADSADDRCSESVYPYPAADSNPVTRPNLDGPVRRLDPTVSFSSVRTIEFWPDGTAHYDTGSGNPWPMIPTTGVNLSIYRYGRTSTISVNGLGKVTLSQQ